jgi:hypothetical protein
MKSLADRDAEDEEQRGDGNRAEEKTLPAAHER